jgi:TPP-dependent pyruvate/acetoin dehydrogenase alpha subunit|tara:strand:- start:4681 stop:5649 length:969 start_codon:yes stop_codon:yes gene_type:complete
MINKNINLELFKMIYKIRKTEEKIAELYKEQEMRCPVHLSIGQESVAAGVCFALKKNDKIISTHRAHAHYIAKGGNLKAMISEIYGKKTGCTNGLGGSMYLQDIKAGVAAAVPIVGSNIAIGTGMAYRSLFERKKNKYLTTIFFGEGATEEGIFSESINFAAIHNLPILFICENNLYSVYTSLKDRQHKKRNIKKLVESHGIESYSIEGNNVSKVYSFTNKIVQKIKKRNRPVFIEFKTYRWLEHCGPNWDDHLKYRPDGELKSWMRKCPLKLIEDKINKKKLLEKNKNKIKKEIELAFKYAQNSSFPEKKIIEKLYKDIEK